MFLVVEVDLVFYNSLLVKEEVEGAQHQEALVSEEPVKKFDLFGQALEEEVVGQEQCLLQNLKEVEAAAEGFHELHHFELEVN